MAELSQINVGGVLYDIKDATARQNTGIELDTEMSDTSEHGVQNKVIKAYIDNALIEEVSKEVAAQIEEQVQDTVKENVEDTLDEKTATDDDIDSLFE